MGVGKGQDPTISPVSKINYLTPQIVSDTNYGA